jgi:hypothetical protein
VLLPLVLFIAVQIAILKILKSYSPQIVQFNDKCQHFIILGDLNFPIIDWKYWTIKKSSTENKFLDALRDHLMLQNICEPTK